MLFSLPQEILDTILSLCSNIKNLRLSYRKANLNQNTYPFLLYYYHPDYLSEIINLKLKYNDEKFISYITKENKRNIRTYSIENIKSIHFTYMIKDDYLNFNSDQLEEIKFNMEFNGVILKYPKDLISLSFGYDFNQEVKNLPEKLKYLSFGFCFNQNIDSLPDSIEELYLGYNFNQEINKLPKNLKKLYIHAKYKYNLSKFNVNIIYLDNLSNKIKTTEFGILSSS